MPVHLDFKTKITEFDDESKDEIKILCLSRKKGEPLKAKLLARKLRNIVGAMGVAVVV